MSYHPTVTVSFCFLLLSLCFRSSCFLSVEFFQWIFGFVYSLFWIFDGLSLLHLNKSCFCYLLRATSSPAFGSFCQHLLYAYRTRLWGQCYDLGLLHLVASTFSNVACPKHGPARDIILIHGVATIEFKEKGTFDCLTTKYKSFPLSPSGHLWQMNKFHVQENIWERCTDRQDGFTIMIMY